ncbi:DUF2793 domain-containing protein [Nereida sp. NH-UV-3]|uniref:DUF2793 domain-containing protein n=1 Tax=Nereida TaxID=282198 RepID=UPI0036F28F62
MTTRSPLLDLPYIQSSQAQKHLTHNDSIRTLDTLVQLSVSDASLAQPPQDASADARFIVAEPALADWAGHGGSIAQLDGEGWVFFTPQIGWRVWAAAQNTLLVWDGAAWHDVVTRNHATLGVNAMADEVNRLALSSKAALFNHDGNGHQLKINKASEQDTASVLFQTNWGGRAELGTVANDDFTIKVSNDGGNFRSAITASNASGQVSFPSGLAGNGARDANLILNGAGELGPDINSLLSATFDESMGPDTRGSWRLSGYTSWVELPDRIQLNANACYEVGVAVCQDIAVGDWSAFSAAERHQQSVAFNCFDSDGALIEAHHHMRYQSAGIDSLSELTAPLAVGDKVIEVSDASGWNDTSDAAEDLGVIIFGYRTANGRLYEGYSRLVQQGLFDVAGVDKSNNRISLLAPWPAALGSPDQPDGTWPIGTKLANSSGGITARACISDVVPSETNTWFRVSSYIGGTDLSGQNTPMQFAPGTASVQLIIGVNSSNISGGANGFPDTGPNHSVWFADIYMREAALSHLERNASKELTVRVPSCESGTNELVYAVPSVSVVRI